MSLSIRKLTNGETVIFRVLDTSTGEREIFYSKEAIPHSIRHYAPDEAMFVEPDAARIMGVLRELYPNHPNCGMPDFENRLCIAESCKFCGAGGAYKCCPYYHEKETK